MAHEFITLVSGLPRSGTSMMMKMLEAGGLPVVTDGIRTADEDNPEGYYEFERVKKLETDQSWIPEARGKVVKLISALLKHLPETEQFKIVFMRRKMDEILASQKQMLIRRGKPTDVTPDQQLATFFERHLRQVGEWMAARPNIEVIYVSYNDLVQDPAPHAQRVAAFLDCGLDAAKMTTVVSDRLYRQRR
jgi:hypothetical protein